MIGVGRLAALVAGGRIADFRWVREQSFGGGTNPIAARRFAQVEFHGQADRGRDRTRRRGRLLAASGQETADVRKGFRGNVESSQLPALQCRELPANGRGVDIHSRGRNRQPPGSVWCALAR